MAGRPMTSQSTGMRGVAVALLVATTSFLDNSQPFRNPAAHARYFSTQGLIDLTSEYFQAQGTPASAL